MNYFLLELFQMHFQLIHNNLGAIIPLPFFESYFSGIVSDAFSCSPLVVLLSPLFLIAELYGLYSPNSFPPMPPIMCKDNDANLAKNSNATGTSGDACSDIALHCIDDVVTIQSTLGGIE